ncbi:MAG: cation diffusion facilitator family transporter, partial [Bacillota bacterium]
MDQRVSTARLSVVSNTLLVVMKLIVGLMMGSVSVISEAIHSGLDLAAALIAFFSLKQAAKPPDQVHRYGHGKIENVSGVIEAILIFVAAIWIIVEAVRRLAHGGTVEALGWGVAIMAISAVVNTIVSEVLFRVARKTESIALEADALHLRTDVYTSVGVAGGLALLKLTGLHILDPLVALGVAALIIRAAWELTMTAFRPLLDVSLPKDEEDQIIAAIREHAT